MAENGTLGNSKKHLASTHSCQEGKHPLTVFSHKTRTNTMSTGQGGLLCCSIYTHLPQDFTAKVGSDANTLKYSAVDGTGVGVLEETRTKSEPLALVTRSST